MKILKFYLLILLLNLYSATTVAGLWDDDPPPPPPPTEDPPSDPPSEPPVEPPPPANTAPSISGPTSHSEDAGNTVKITITASDAEGDAITLSASNLPEGSTFNPTTGTFEWNTACDDDGLYDGLTFTATDSKGAASSMTVSLNIGKMDQVDYYGTMIPKVQAELHKLAKSKKSCSVKGWDNQLSVAAKHFNRGKVRQGMGMINHVCKELAHFAKKKKIASAEPMSSMLCCETEKPKTKKKHSCSRR